MNSRLQSLLAALAFSCVAASAVARDCEQEPNMAAVRACAADQLSQQLAATYADTLGYVQSKDPRAAGLLEAAQKSWERFAADSCEYSVAARQTETMANDARLQCRAAFVDARMKVLKAYRRQFGQTDG